jgi:glutamine synthetase
VFSSRLGQLNQGETMDTKEIVERASADGVKFISLQFTDVLGATKSATLPVTRLGEALDQGVWFDGSSIEGFARIQESDMFLRPDPNTYQLLPWHTPEHQRARLLCDVYSPDGAPFPGDPRYVLRRAAERAAQMGYHFNTGPELEFYIFKADGAPRPVLHDVVGYFDFSPRDLAQHVRSEIVLALQAMGMQVEMSHHEVGPGQHEIDFRYADALTSADNAITLKYAVKAIAHTNNVYATFMPKPMFGKPGNGMHTHQSLTDPEGKNLFYSPDDKYHLSRLAYHFVAGQMAHARALAAIVAPTVNSYKRLVPGYEAPVYVCWAQINRSALIRIPRSNPGQASAARAELRCPDPSCNPYLAFAVMLAAGLDGIEKQLEPAPAVDEDVFEFTPKDLAARGIATLPGTLDEALDALSKDEVIRGALGEHVYEAFMRAKRSEWDEYRVQVSDWEVGRYFEIL